MGRKKSAVKISWLNFPQTNPWTSVGVSCRYIYLPVQFQLQLPPTSHLLWRRRLAEEFLCSRKVEEVCGAGVLHDDAMAFRSIGISIASWSLWSRRRRFAIATPVPLHLQIDIVHTVAIESYRISSPSTFARSLYPVCLLLLSWAYVVCKSLLTCNKFAFIARLCLLYGTPRHLFVFFFKQTHMTWTWCLYYVYGIHISVNMYPPGGAGWMAGLVWLA